MGVLDSWLAKSKTEFLVGDKCTYADLAFIPWHTIVPSIMGEDKIDIGSEYPKYDKWMETCMNRPAVKKVLEDKANAKH